MKWVEISVQAPREYVEPLSTIFHRYSRGGVVVEEAGGYNPDEGESPPWDAFVTLRTYLPVNATTRSNKAHIEVAVRLVSLVQPLPPLQERLVEEADWAEAWKRHFQVFHVTPRLVVQPTWLSYAPAAGEVIIRMDPGLAFGTGHHPTTSMCLRELEAMVSPGDRVLDVGTGTGILAIAAVKLGARQAVALDIEAQAVRVARGNARANGVGKAIQVVRGTLPQEQAPAAAFDVAVANISTVAIVGMAQDMALALRPEGCLIASGIVEERAEETVDALRRAGLVLRRRAQEGLWVILVATRPQE